MNTKLRRASAAAFLLLAAACEEAGQTVVSIDEKGAIMGLVFLDRNGDGVTNPGVDASLPGVRVALLAGTRSIAETVTDSLGSFRVLDVPVGTYTVFVDEASAGDSLSITTIDSSTVTVIPGDTTVARIIFGYFSATASEIANLPRGQRLTYVGTALNAWSAFGDSTVHIADSTGVVRVAGIPPVTVNAGDRVRVVASAGTRDGYPALVDATIVAVSQGAAPVPVPLSTREVADPADSIAASLVRIQSAVMLEGLTLPGGDVLLTVDDGSGPAEVILDVHAGINTAIPIARGAELDITGVLVPLDGSPPRWRLKPRRSADVAVAYPVVSIATARSQAIGQYAFVHGIVLNDLNAFADNTLHLADTSAAIRINARPGFISAGDSVSVLGRIGMTESQPVLLDGIVSVFARTAVPPALDITVAEAVTARDGTLDARLIRVRNVVVHDTASVSGNRRIRVRAGTDTVDVILDRTGFGGITPPAIGANIDVTGLLVPAAGGRWFIKPRNSADITAN